VEWSCIAITPKRNLAKLFSTDNQQVLDYLELFFKKHPTHNYQVMSLMVGEKLHLYDKSVRLNEKITKIDATLVKWLGGGIPQDLVKDLYQWTKDFIGTKTATNHIKSRGKITLLTWHFGRWRKYSVTESDTSLTQTEEGKMYFHLIQQHLTPIVDAAFRINFPELRKFMVNVNGEHENNASIAFKGFALNASISTWHVDAHDYVNGICALIPFGEYEQGELVIPDLCLTFNLRPGDIFFFASRRLIHGNLQSRGVRYSIVYFLHQVAVSDFFVRSNVFQSIEQALTYCKSHYAYKPNSPSKAKSNCSV